MEINDDVGKIIAEIDNSVNEVDKHEVSPSRTDNSAKRQMKKNDSGICDEKSDSSCDESYKRKKMNDMEADAGDASKTQPSDSTDKPEGFLKKSKFKYRNYRNYKSENDKANSDDDTDSKSAQVKKVN